MAPTAAECAPRALLARVLPWVGLLMCLSCGQVRITLVQAPGAALCMYSFFVCGSLRRLPILWTGTGLSHARLHRVYLLVRD